MRSIVLAAAVFVSALSPAFAEDIFPAIADPEVRKECVECHMLYQPEMLTGKAWTVMMDGLSDHFGENASLDPAKAKRILAYLTANAADVTSFKDAKRFVRNIDVNNPPLKITATPRYLHKHERISPEVWKRKNIGSKANCIGCHLDAGKGDYENIAAALMYQWTTK